MMVGPRRVRIASGLRDPPRHVVVTALDRTGHHDHAANDGLSDDDAPFCSTRLTVSRREKPVDVPMHAPAVRHAITRTHALHVNADRQSPRDRMCALLVLVCLRLSYFSSFHHGLGVRACASSSSSRSVSR